MKRQAILLISLVAILLLVLLLGNPYSTSWLLKCPLYLLTGWQCPICGMQRQLHSLLVCDFAEAWRLNAVLLLCYPYLAILFLSQVFTKVRDSKLGTLCNSNKAILSFIAIMIIWGVIRNIS